MQPEETLNRLKKSQAFKQWIEGSNGNAESYLAHCFVMYDGQKENEWQFGYYVPCRDRIVTFNVSREISVGPESEIFKEGENALDKLEIGNVNIDARDAIDSARKLQEQKYPMDKPQKTILILQSIGGEPIYNITFVTAVFNTLNIKVNAKSGEVISDKISSIMSLGKFDK